jgi:gliding motility-associated-like protein
MKNKLLLFLLFFSFLGNSVFAESFTKTSTALKINWQQTKSLILKDTIKKSTKVGKTAKSAAIIPAPQTTAGSACKEAGDLTVRVSMAASGGSGDLIEWFASQNSTDILHTGSIYSPTISQNTTYYVRTHTGPDFSIRVPVVASVYTSPPTVSLSVSPSNAVICEGVPLTFTANGGADLFEFSVDGVVKQAMSTSRDFQTTTLKKGQVVSVKTRYAVTFDGSITETAWGKGSMEDNALSAPLSLNAQNGYINSLRISPTETKLVFGVSGKLADDRSMLLFLDTKPGGFNLANYGNEAPSSQSVRGFNYFNNNPSNFDSYFQADYCLAISKEVGGSNYFADIIELKSGVSSKVNLGMATSGVPSSTMGVSDGNTGMSDYNLGFEVEVLKSLIGYTVGDIKFFAFTMKDVSEIDYSVTNSFISPELNNALDYGSGAIDYNVADPNPVVVSADALTPCYKTANILVNLEENPTQATVGADQVNCTLTSTSLGGNTPTIGSGVWSVKSGPGMATFSSPNNGSSTATVITQGTYVFTWTISNGLCPSTSADIKVDFNLPIVPPASGGNKTECVSTPIQTLTATATAQAGESVVWYTTATGGSVVTDPSLSSIGSVTYYAEAASTTTPCVSSSRTVVTLTINARPVVPTSGGDQTVCALSPIQTLTAMATAQAGESVVWYTASTGGTMVSNPILNALGTVTYYAESVNDLTSCTSTTRVPVTLILNDTPVAPTSGGNKTECASAPIQTLTATATAQAGESVVWYTAATGGSVVTDPSLSSIGTVTYYAEAASTTTPCVSSSRTAVILTINARPVVPTSGGDQTACASSPIQTLTAMATVPAGESVVWYTASTGGIMVSNPILNALGTVTYYAESVNDLTSCTSTTRVPVTLTLNDTPVTPTSGGNKTECASTPIQTLTATATAQAGESVVWYTTATGGSVVTDPSFSSIGTVTYYAEATSTTTPCVSSSRTAVILTINARPVVPTSGGDQTACASSPIQTLTAMAIAQAGESVVWYTASTGGTMVSNPILNALGAVTYYAESVNDLTSCTSTTRVPVTLILNDTPVAPTSGGNKTECASAPIQTLTATATAQAGESVVWYTAATGGSVVTDPSLSSIGTVTYYAEAASTTTPCVSSSRTAVILTINARPVVPTSGGDQTACALLPIQTLTAMATAQAGESVVWYTASTGGTMVSNPTLNSLGTVTYYAESVNDLTSCTSTTRVPVTLILNDTPVAPTSGGNKTECASTPIQTLTATATVQAGESVVWFTAATGGSVVTDPSLNSIGTVTYYAETASTTTPCVSSSRTAVILTINARPVIPTSGGDQTACASSPIQTLTAMATAPAGESVVWYTASTGGTIVSNPTLSSLGTVTYYAESVNDLTSCTSTTRVPVTLTLNDTPVTPTSGGNKTECASTPIQTLTATATAQAGESVVWYTTATGDSVVTDPSLSSIGTVTYYAEAASTTTPCVSSSRTAVILTINARPVVPTSGGDQTACALLPIQTLTAMATAQAGESVVWYTASTGGTMVSNPILNALGTVTYYAESVNDLTSCTSTTRVPVVLTLNPRPVVPISGGDQTVCTDGTSTQTLTANATGTSITWYTAATGGAMVSNPTQVGVGTTTYYAESSNGLCPSLTRTGITLTIVGVVPNPVVSDQTACSNGTATQTLTATATGNTITWYTTEVGGTVVTNPTQVGVGTSTYYAESSIGNCLSVARTKVVLNITAVPLLPTATVTKQTTCTSSTGEITIAAQPGVEYSIGNGYQDSPIFTNVPSGTYAIAVRFKNNNACPVAGVSQTIRPIPQQIQFVIDGNCEDKDYILTASAMANSYDVNNVDYEWKDSAGKIVGTNSNMLNVSELLSATSEREIFPLNYTLTIISTATGCQTTNSFKVETITCNIQKGISPDGNGSNENFDLRLMDVKKLTIFDRYGIKVFSKSNYTDEWKGQSDKGDELPSATYYYVIELNEGQAKTGWIYLIREKQ